MSRPRFPVPPFPGSRLRRAVRADFRTPGLSDSRTPGLSDSRTPGLSDSRTLGLSDSSREKAARRSRAAFSLLELLGVVLVCFILWGFLFPAAEGMVRNRRRRQAEADVQAIASALLAYHREYGHYPGEEAGRPCDAIYLPEGVTCGYPEMDELEPELLYRALCVSDDADRLALNPRQVVFLEENPSRMKDGILLDPWGDPYVAVVDADENGWIGSEDGENAMGSFPVADAAAGGARSHEVPARREAVYVFSWGGSHAAPVTSAREVRQ